MIFKVLSGLQLQREELKMLVEHAEFSFPFGDFLVRVNVGSAAESGYAGTQIVGVKDRAGVPVVSRNRRRARGRGSPGPTCDQPPPSPFFTWPRSAPPRRLRYAAVSIRCPCSTFPTSRSLARSWYL